MFYLGLIILGAVLIAAVVGIISVSRKTYTTFPVACAGSVDARYPATERVKLPSNFSFGGKKGMPSEAAEMETYIVRGNSMQYANIRPNDIVFVSPVDLKTIDRKLPMITLLSFTPKAPGMASHKIRRTWKVVASDINERDFDAEMDRILASEAFEALRNEMGNRCPADSELKEIARRSLRRYRESARHDLAEPIVISTTFRTENDRLEFSIHPLSSVKGQVAFVSHQQS